ncbi:hypothetical protein FSP39_020119 [Pinctada imbricata]|uniref:Uncharacterized protein n=1 Tax=Pinctada imbricata TaxID=66713 RepID=A0AA88XWG1_PINIB|nr:hypothetical protein FSP39_020119 [Pinctada imbricata]
MRVSDTLPRDKDGVFVQSRIVNKMRCWTPSRTFYLRNKEKAEVNRERVQRRFNLKLYEFVPASDILIPKAPALRCVSRNKVDHIVERLNRPMSEKGPVRSTLQPLFTKNENVDEYKRIGIKAAQHTTQNTWIEITERLHNHQTYMSRVRSARSEKPFPPKPLHCTFCA